MMNNTWVLVAHRGGARVFESKGPGKGLNLLQDIPHPEGSVVRRPSLNATGLPSPSRALGHGALFCFAGPGRPAVRQTPPAHNGSTPREARLPGTTRHRFALPGAQRLKNKDIGADKPGRSFDSRGQSRHSLSTEQQATEHLAEQFAKHLSTLLDDGRHQQRYAKLVLVAEPRFLGSLRAALSSPTAALVTATLGKDLGGVEPHNMPRHLAETLRL